MGRNDYEPISTKFQRPRKLTKWSFKRIFGSIYIGGYIKDVTIANKMYVGKNGAEGVLCRW